jgi:hypothetical protein
MTGCSDGGCSASHGDAAPAGEARMAFPGAQVRSPTADSEDMIDATQTGLAGIQNALQRFDRGSARVSDAGSPEQIAEGAVDIDEARTAVKANVAVLRASDRTIGSLLDIIA